MTGSSSGRGRKKRAASVGPAIASEPSLMKDWKQPDVDVEEPLCYVPPDELPSGVEFDPLVEMTIALRAAQEVWHDSTTTNTLNLDKSVQRDQMQMLIELGGQKLSLLDPSSEVIGEHAARAAMGVGVYNIVRLHGWEDISVDSMNQLCTIATKRLQKYVRHFQILEEAREEGEPMVPCSVVHLLQKNGIGDCGVMEEYLEKQCREKFNTVKDECLKLIAEEPSLSSEPKTSLVVEPSDSYEQPAAPILDSLGLGLGKTMFSLLEQGVQRLEMAEKKREMKEKREMGEDEERGEIEEDEERREMKENEESLAEEEELDIEEDGENDLSEQSAGHSGDEEDEERKIKKVMRKKVRKRSSHLPSPEPESQDSQETSVKSRADPNPKPDGSENIRVWIESIGAELTANEDAERTPRPLKSILKSPHRVQRVEEESIELNSPERAERHQDLEPEGSPHRVKRVEESIEWKSPEKAELADRDQDLELERSPHRAPSVEHLIPESTEMYHNPAHEGTCARTRVHVPWTRMHTDQEVPCDTFDTVPAEVEIAKQEPKGASKKRRSRSGSAAPSTVPFDRIGGIGVQLVKKEEERMMTFEERVDSLFDVPVIPRRESAPQQNMEPIVKKEEEEQDGDVDEGNQMNEDPVVEPVTPRRGRGRPKKKESVVKEEGEESEKANENNMMDQAAIVEPVTSRKGRGRPKKSESVVRKEGEETDEDDMMDQAAVEPVTPRRGRGRPRKSAEPVTPRRGRGRPRKSTESMVRTDGEEDDEDAIVEPVTPRRGRGRPRKSTESLVREEGEKSDEDDMMDQPAVVEPVTPRRGRGRPRKSTESLVREEGEKSDEDDMMDQSAVVEPTTSGRERMKTEETRKVAEPSTPGRERKKTEETRKVAEPTTPGRGRGRPPKEKKDVTGKDKHDNVTPQVQATRSRAVRGRTSKHQRIGLEDYEDFLPVAKRTRTGATQSQKTDQSQPGSATPAAAARSPSPVVSASASVPQPRRVGRAPSEYLEEKHKRARSGSRF